VSKSIGVVVQVEGRHPGVTTYSFIAAPAALLALASSLERLARAPLGARFDERVSARGNPGARTAIAFAQCAPEQVVQLQASSSLVRRRRAFALVFYPVIALLSVVGAATVVRSVLAWLH
jgi:hypothetical protein